MYCVKCGVELADSEVKCPLCKTPVYYPEAKRGELSFPEYKKTREEISARGLYFIISVFFAIAGIISVICNLTVNAEISWSMHVIGALIVSYVVIILPGWFPHPSPAIFVPIDFGVVAIYLFCINFVMGGAWFWSFALPIVAFAALVVCSVTILIYYLRRGYLYIWGGAFIAVGVFMPILELLLHWNFKILHERLVWSYYPLTSLVLIGIMLIVVAIVRPFRESLRKIFSL